MSRRPRLPWTWQGALWLGLVLLLMAPPFLSSFMLALLTQALIYAILAMSLDVVLGYLGLASLGHAAYLGLGAYGVGILTTRHGADFWTALIVGVGLAAAVAALFGLVALRATGVYFLMITLALGMVVWGLAQRWVSLTQGDNGISAVPRPALGAGLTLADSGAFYYATLAGFLVVLGLLWTIVRSPFGHTLVGIRESESRMRTLGYHVWLHKYIAFVISGSCAGLAGVISSARLDSANPTLGTFDLLDAIAAVVIGGASLLGGAGTILGTATGVLLIVTIRNGLTLLGVNPFFQQTTVGAIIIVAAVLGHLSKRRQA